MNMRGPEGMASHGRQQLTRRTVIRNWIADWQDGSESIGPRGVGPKAGPQMSLRLIFVLDVIQLVGSRLPNLNQRPSNWLACGIAYTAAHDQRLARFLPQ